MFHQPAGVLLLRILLAVSLHILLMIQAHADDPSSAATMILNTQRYGVPHCGPWLITATRVLFWFYVANSFLTTNLHIVWISRATPFKTIEFQPPMFILVLNAMLTGTIASAISENQPPHHRVPVCPVLQPSTGVRY